MSFRSMRVWWGVGSLLGFALACGGAGPDEAVPEAVPKSKVDPKPAPTPTPEVECFHALGFPSDAARAHALKMAQAQYPDMTDDRLTAKPADLDLDDKEDWIIHTDKCYAPGCVGAGYMRRPECGGNYCYVGSAPENLFGYLADEVDFTCQPAFFDVG